MYAEELLDTEFTRAKRKLFGNDNSDEVYRGVIESMDGNLKRSRSISQSHTYQEFNVDDISDEVYSGVIESIDCNLKRSR